MSKLGNVIVICIFANIINGRGFAETGQGNKMKDRDIFTAVYPKGKYRAVETIEVINKTARSRRARAFDREMLQFRRTMESASGDNMRAVIKTVDETNRSLSRILGIDDVGKLENNVGNWESRLIGKEHIEAVAGWEVEQFCQQDSFFPLPSFTYGFRTFLRDYPTLSSTQDKDVQKYFDFIEQKATFKNKQGEEAAVSILYAPSAEKARFAFVYFFTAWPCGSTSMASTGIFDQYFRIQDGPGDSCLIQAHKAVKNTEGLYGLLSFSGIRFVFSMKHSDDLENSWLWYDNEVVFFRNNCIVTLVHSWPARSGPMIDLEDRSDIMELAKQIDSKLVGLIEKD